LHLLTGIAMTCASVVQREISQPPMDNGPRFARLDTPIVLAHGLFGFTRIGFGPLTLTNYFRGIPQALETAGNRVLVTRVPSIAGVEHRARRLGDQIIRAFGDEPVHLIGHSMGGLDARKLLADPLWQKRVLSVTTIGTPHQGTSLADFAKLRVGRVYRLLQALGVDPQGCLDVTRSAAQRFHDRHPLSPSLPCFSVAGDPSAELVSWPLRRLHAVLMELEGPNDGLVSVESANAFGCPLPRWPVDHLRQLNWLTSDEPAPAAPAPLELYAQVVARLASLGFGSDRGPEGLNGSATGPHPGSALTTEQPSTLAG
jgi:triacylglycerol lipase